MSAWLASLVLLTAASANGRVGLFVGSNGAPEGRTPLQHAEADARRVRRVFVELGGIAAEDAHLLEAPTADQILEAIRRAGAGAQLLVFYYSGHADSRALLLEGSELSFTELNDTLDSVGAQLSLHLVDACRSGALTRRKGASLGERLQFSTAERGEGRVVITSSAESEDSLESDDLGGSFFTLHMATGLRGAADTDSDGQVTLGEAYRYVYGRTVESTLSAGATQHPTFAYDLSGQGDLVLTWPPRAGGTMVFGEGDYVVVEPVSGRVAAEVVTPGARVSLSAGTYRIKKRTRTEVWSGMVRVGSGDQLEADRFLTERVAHARLVRKGRPEDPTLSSVVRVMGGVRGAIDPGLRSAPMLRAGYELALPWLSVMPYVSLAWGGPFSTPRFAYHSREAGFGVLASRALDFRWVTLRGGLAGEAVMLSQTEDAGREPTRTAWAGAFATQIAVESPPVFGDFLVAVAGEAALYVYGASSATLAPAEGELVTRPTFRLFLSVGYEL